MLPPHWEVAIGAAAAAAAAINVGQHTCTLQWVYCGPSTALIPHLLFCRLTGSHRCWPGQKMQWRRRAGNESTT